MEEKNLTESYKRLEDQTVEFSVTDAIDVSIEMDLQAEVFKSSIYQSL